MDMVGRGQKDAGSSSRPGFFYCLISKAEKKKG